MSVIREIYMAFHDTKNRLYRKRVLLLRKRDSVCFLYAEKGKAVMKKTNDVSRLAGVSRRTLQYYNDEGLLPVERSSQNYRLYSDSDLERIWEILIYKEMDFELREIQTILGCSEKQKQQYLELKRKKIRDKMTELEVQTCLIAIVKEYGMPVRPEESEGITYSEGIEKIKREIKGKGRFCCCRKTEG